MTACELNSPQKAREDFYLDVIEQPKKLKYGFDLDLYNIVKKKVRRGDTFGTILESHGIDYQGVYNVLQAIKKDVNVKRLVAGKPYQLLYTKDSMAHQSIYL